MYDTTVRIANSNYMFSETLRGHTVWKLATPKILEKAREQFGCSTLNGAELENQVQITEDVLRVLQGGGGTSGSHWEKRIFLNDVMTSGTELNNVYSTVTFAYFEDSG